MLLANGRCSGHRGVDMQPHTFRFAKFSNLGDRIDRQGRCRPDRRADKKRLQSRRAIRGDLPGEFVGVH